MEELYMHVRQLFYFFKRVLEEMFPYFEVWRMFDINIRFFSLCYCSNLPSFFLVYPEFQVDLR